MVKLDRLLKSTAHIATGCLRDVSLQMIHETFALEIKRVLLCPQPNCTRKYKRVSRLEETGYHIAGDTEFDERAAMARRVVLYGNEGVPSCTRLYVTRVPRG